jgi:hypothetical protein
MESAQRQSSAARLIRARCSEWLGDIFLLLITGNGEKKDVDDAI